MTQAADATPAVGTRQEIVEAARRLFLERGYEGTSVALIAEQVGIRPAALYWHFASKQAIFAHVVESDLEDFLTEIERVDPHTTPTERLWALAAGHVRFNLARRDLAGAYSEVFGVSQLSRVLADERQAEVRGLVRRYLDRLVDVLRAGVAEGTFAVEAVVPVAFAIANMCEYAMLWYRPDGPMDAEAIAALHGDLAVRMVTPATGRPGRRRRR